MTAIDATASTNVADADGAAGPTGPAIAEDTTSRIFSTTMMISAVRCLLTYIVFPWMLPLFGLAKSVGPGIGLAVGAVAIFFNVLTIRRFHKADHRWKWQMTALSLTVITMLSVLAVQDLTELI